MSYVLQPLLGIRLMREDRARGELTAARRVVRAAEEALDARRRDLAAYEETREARRDRIYDAIMGRAVSRDRLDMAAEAVARIDEEGSLKRDNVRQAEREVAKRREEESAARTQFVLATKNRMKIDEHRSVCLAADAVEQEHRAECELEDFMVRKLEI